MYVRLVLSQVRKITRHTVRFWYLLLYSFVKSTPVPLMKLGPDISSGCLCNKQHVHSLSKARPIVQYMRSKHYTCTRPWCPWNAPVEIYNFLIGCPLPEEKMPWCPCPFKNEAYSPDVPSWFVMQWSLTDFNQTVAGQNIIDLTTVPDLYICIRF